MQILCHRGLWNELEEQNTLNAFKRAFESGFGVELDVRDSNSKIIISHDPPHKRNLVFLNDFFELFKNSSVTAPTIAINIKADGIAGAISELIKQHNISNYFTFDMSIPEMLCYKELGLKYFSRVSEYEKEPVLIDNAAGIWLDAFKSGWYAEGDLNGFLENKKDVCVVSSELHGRNNQSQWALIKKFSNSSCFMLCTDKPYKAREYFK